MKFRYGNAVRIIGGTLFYQGVIGYVRQYEVRDKSYRYLIRILGSSDEVWCFENELEKA